MQEYYRRWKFKHVNEKRFIDAMEDVSGEDLDWFFRPWLHDTRTLDYGINNWKKNQKGEILVFSFHGLPSDSLDKGDPYHCFCQNG